MHCSCQAQNNQTKNKKLKSFDVCQECFKAKNHKEKISGKINDLNVYTYKKKLVQLKNMVDQCFAIQEKNNIKNQNQNNNLIRHEQDLGKISNFHFTLNRDNLKPVLKELDPKRMINSKEEISHIFREDLIYQNMQQAQQQQLTVTNPDHEILKDLQDSQYYQTKNIIKEKKSLQDQLKQQEIQLKKQQKQKNNNKIIYLPAYLKQQQRNKNLKIRQQDNKISARDHIKRTIEKKINNKNDIKPQSLEKEDKNSFDENYNKSYENYYKNSTNNDNLVEIKEQNLLDSDKNEGYLQIQTINTNSYEQEIQTKKIFHSQNPTQSSSPKQHNSKENQLASKNLIQKKQYNNHPFHSDKNSPKNYNVDTQKRQNDINNNLKSQKQANIQQFSKYLNQSSEQEQQILEIQDENIDIQDESLYNSHITQKNKENLIKFNESLTETDQKEHESNEGSKFFRYSQFLQQQEQAFNTLDNQSQIQRNQNFQKQQPYNNQFSNENTPPQTPKYSKFKTDQRISQIYEKMQKQNSKKILEKKYQQSKTISPIKKTYEAQQIIVLENKIAQKKLQNQINFSKIIQQELEISQQLEDLSQNLTPKRNFQQKNKVKWVKKNNEFQLVKIEEKDSKQAKLQKISSSELFKPILNTINSKQFQNQLNQKQKEQIQSKINPQSPSSSSQQNKKQNNDNFNNYNSDNQISDFQQELQQLNQNNNTSNQNSKRRMSLPIQNSGKNADNLNNNDHNNSFTGELENQSQFLSKQTENNNQKNDYKIKNKQSKNILEQEQKKQIQNQNLQQKLQKVRRKQVIQHKLDKLKPKLMTKRDAIIKQITETHIQLNHKKCDQSI
ncbi:hypothetical protein PPERSA_09207 [Pseudocohnilembus persalinus]|uniref:Uncharacterized protein n=1 Tax=Pseudocohnilembus persalinus TaxID=266149 RepID=A0A0V0R4A9_PSEPJ|nr:hypothetical protein PPERSA_09207 [Pseudocohnilembus persalinus]|eukprot:KRX09323.1 hypothetical protein PPERSA_09207 [Pseudocohnilembus persalinus]